MSKIDFKVVADHALANAVSLLEQYLPDGKLQSHEYVALNPTRADSKIGSFKINVSTGAWSDFATGDKGGDLISLLAYIEGVSQQDAAKQIADFLSLDDKTISKQNPTPKQTKTPEPTERDKWVPILPVPENAPEPTGRHYHYGACQNRWAYRDQQGQLLGYAYRFVGSDDRKVVLIHTWCKNQDGACEWRWRGFDEKRPMYGLDSLKKSGKVLIVEGEKCAEAARDIFPDNPVISWPGGTKAVSKVDFTPLKGRDIILWPDNDEVGVTAMVSVMFFLPNRTAVKMILPDRAKLPKTWDIADAIADGWDKCRIKQFIADNLYDPQTDTFWWIGGNDKSPSVKISQAKLLRFLEARGFCKFYPKNSQQSVFLRIQSNIAEEVTAEMMRDYVIKFIHRLPILLPETRSIEIPRGKLYSALVKSANIFFSKDKIECLKVVKPNFHKDKKTEVNFYFQNGYVTATREGRTFQSYNKLDGVIWRKQRINRDFDETIDDPPDSEFGRFLMHVSNTDVDRYSALLTAVGYMLHRHKNRACAKAIIMVDETCSDNPEGRTGKSLFATALEHIRNTETIDGKLFDFKSQFSFQNIGMDTNIVVFDDVRKKFYFENLFHIITSGMEVERKGRDRIRYDFEDSPKILITTNYMVEGEGGSADERKAEYEFSSYFNPKWTPRDEFKHNLFDDWDASEWASFDCFMVHCAIMYMIRGLQRSKTVNIRMRKLLQETSQEFVDWMDDNFNLIEGIFQKKHQLFDDFCDANKEYRKRVEIGRFSQNRFTKWLRLYAQHNGHKYEDKTERIQGLKPARCVKITRNGNETA